MSIYDLLLPLPKNYLNILVNSISSQSANLNGGPLTNVGSINGMPIPSFVFDFNSASIIYRPGGPLVNDSNIVNTWTAVLSKASQINVNQILNIYFDDSVVSPCPINTSYDFQSRANFYSVNSNYNTYTQVQINDGALISNLLSISGSLQLNCQSITGPNLAFNNDGNFYVSNFAYIEGTVDAVVASIQMNSLSVFIGISNFSSIYLGSLQTSFISLGNTSFVVISLIDNSYVSNNLISGDNTSSLLYLYDASSFNSFSNTGLVGTADYNPIDNCQGVSYNDSVLPAFGSTNVQGALDSLKTNGLNTSGNVICSTVSPTNQTRIQFMSTTFMTYIAGTVNVPYTQWNNLIFSYGGITCDGTTFTVPTSGLYMIETQTNWDTTLVGDVTVREIGVIYVNTGIFYGVNTVPSIPLQKIRQSTSTMLQLNAGDQLQQYVSMGSASNINVGELGLGLYPPLFTIYKLI